MRIGPMAWSAVPASALVLAAVASAQQIPPRLPASGSAPPEFQQIEEARARAEQPQKAGRPLPAAPTPPPELQEIERRRQQAPEQPAATPAPPTREEILEKLREQPGGRERLEEARKRGARIPESASLGRSWSDRLLAVLSWLNPLHVETAEAQTPAYSLTLNTTTYGSSTPYGYWYFEGIDVWCTNCRYLNATGAGTSIFDKPRVSISLDVPTSGWYIMSFSGTQGYNKASLAHYGAGTTGWRQVWTWDYSSQSPWSAMVTWPALLELSAGRHYFILRPTQGAMFVNSFQMYSFP